MSCDNRHTSLDGGVWRLGESCSLGTMTDLAGDVTWRTKCLACGVYSDAIPPKVAMKWGVPTFDVDMRHRSVLDDDRDIMATGWYTFKIVSVESVKVKRGKNEGKPMYKMGFMVHEGKYRGRTLTKWVCLFDPAWISYLQLAKAFDWEVEYGEDAEPIARPEKDFMGKIVKGMVKHEPGFRDDGLVAALANFTKAGADTSNRGKVRVII